MGERRCDTGWRKGCEPLASDNGRVPIWNGAKAVIASVAQTIVPSLTRIEGLTICVRQPAELAAELHGNPNRAPKLAASQVALAPAAMSALIEAQEHMAGDATPDRPQRHGPGRSTTSCRA